MFKITVLFIVVTIVVMTLSSCQTTKTISRKPVGVPGQITPINSHEEATKYLEERYSKEELEKTRKAQE